MTATLTISLSPEILKTLKAEKSIALAVTSGSGAAPSPRASNGTARSYRPGSLPARLLSWAGGRKRPFGIDDVVKKLRIKRAHASMLLSYVLKGGAVKRVGRGEYAAA